MSEPPKSKFQLKLEERRAREAAEAAEAAAAKAAEEHDADLVPDDPYNLTDADRALDAAIERIDIIDAYNRYVGKMRPTVRPGQRENIMISCPNPWHTDKNPDAWINLDKQVWACGPCGFTGGDLHDFAAIAKGYAYPNAYKTDGTFHQLREAIAADFGFVITKLPGGAFAVSEAESEDAEDAAPVAADAPTEAPADSAGADIIELYEEDENILIPKLDWKKLVEPNTFIYEYMKATKIDDVPLEYHYFHALLGLGMALGRDVTLYDSIPVYGNLFVCTLGRSGSGKSKAKWHLDRLLAAALPYKHDDPFSKGTLMVQSPGSAEMLIKYFDKPITDPSDPKVVIANAQVRGLITYNELSSLVGRSGRMGSVIKPTLMQFYDCEEVVSTSSLTHGVKEAEHPFASAITSTQPKALKDLLGKADDSSGFLNRWVYVLGTAKKRDAIGGARVDMTPAVGPLEEILAWASTFKRGEQVIWSQEAAALFTEFFYERIEPDKRRNESDMMVRIDLVLKKIILLLTANLKLKEVPVEAVEAALSLYDYLIAGFAVPAAEVGRTVIGDVQEAIMNLAMKQFKLDGKGITLRQVSKSLWRRNYSQKMLADTVDAMVKMGLLSVVQPKQGAQGRPAVRYRYVQ